MATIALLIVLIVIIYNSRYSGYLPLLGTAHNIAHERAGLEKDAEIVVFREGSPWDWGVSQTVVLRMNSESFAFIWQQAKSKGYENTPIKEIIKSNGRNAEYWDPEIEGIYKFAEINNTTKLSIVRC
ncbi:MAG: hypothetical protein IAF08_06955 [Rhizobacter sp.]|nr:hypothetical protein [Chlorobiales bacterium]